MICNKPNEDFIAFHEGVSKVVEHMENSPNWGCVSEQNPEWSVILVPESNTDHEGIIKIPDEFFQGIKLVNTRCFLLEEDNPAWCSEHDLPFVRTDNFQEGLTKDSLELKNLIDVIISYCKKMGITHLYGIRERRVALYGYIKNEVQYGVIGFKNYKEE